MDCDGRMISRSKTNTMPSSISISAGTTRWNPFVCAGTGDPDEGNPAFRLAPDIQYVRRPWFRIVFVHLRQPYADDTSSPFTQPSRGGGGNGLLEEKPDVPALTRPGSL